MASADLLLHPVRLRLVQAFLGDRTLTTTDLRADLPDVAVATLYRHVGVLADAGVLTVVGKRKVRGAAERSYRLDVAAASLSSTDVAAMTADDHRRAFTTFAAALMADFDRYVRRAAPDGGSPDLAAVLKARMAHRPDGARRRRLVTTVHLPAD